MTSHFKEHPAYIARHLYKKHDAAIRIPTLHDSILKEALAIYTANSGKGALTLDQSEAVAKMMELYEIVVAMFGASAGFDYRRYFTEHEPKDRLNFILAAANHIADLTEEKDGQPFRNGKERFKENVIPLQKAFSLSVPPSAGG